MSNWGLLMGLGEGLQQAGGMLADNGKQKLAAKLDQEKEVRAAARADRLRELDQLSYDKTVPELSSDGMWMNVKYAKNGNRMDSTIASPDQQIALSAAMDKDKLDAKKSLLDVNLAEKKFADYDTDKSLERQLTQSQIARNRDTGLAAITRASNVGTGKSTAPASLSEAADTLVDNYPDLVKQVTTAPAGETPLLTAAEVQRVATESVKIAAQRGQDAAAIFKDALRIRANGARRGRGLELDLGN